MLGEHESDCALNIDPERGECDCFGEPCQRCGAVGEIIEFGEWLICPDCNGNCVLRPEAD